MRELKLDNNILEVVLLGEVVLFEM